MASEDLIEVDIGDRCLTIEQSPGHESLVQAFFDEDTQPPHWAVVWPSARALALVIASSPDLRGKRVIELGCGVGLLGVVAAARGADVVVSDIEPLATQLAAKNAERNDLQVEALTFDWNDPPDDLGLFDGIAAADVLYDDGMLAGVLRFIGRHLASGGMAFLADPNRVMDGGLRGAARLHGLEVHSVVLQGGMSMVGGVTIHRFERRRRG